MRLARGPVGEQPLLDALLPRDDALLVLPRVRARCVPAEELDEEEACVGGG